MAKVSITYFGAHALLVEGPKVIDRKVNQQLVQLKNKIEATFEFVEVVCTYQSLAVYLKEKEELSQIKSAIEDWLPQPEEKENIVSRKVFIPVCYDETLGLDLEKVANANQLEVEEVIQKHSERTYHVYFIGFLPGFPYLGGLNEQLATPRLQTPRQKINAGAVGIADQQTGVYPSASPGGWNIIGQTPIQLFNPKQGALLQAGDTVIFESVSSEQFKDIEEKVRQNQYKIKLRHD